MLCAPNNRLRLFSYHTRKSTLFAKYRYPLNYGAFKPLSAVWLLSCAEKFTYVLQCVYCWWFMIVVFELFHPRALFTIVLVVLPYARYDRWLLFSAIVKIKWQPAFGGPAPRLTVTEKRVKSKEYEANYVFLSKGWCKTPTHGTNKQLIRFPLVPLFYVLSSFTTALLY